MRRLQSKLHNTVVKLEQEKFNSTKTLMVLQDKVQEYQREVEDSKPMLSRYISRYGDLNLLFCSVAFPF